MQVITSARKYFANALKLVPRDSEIFGLPGYRENAIKLDAKHEDMCRFDMSNERDKTFFLFVEANLSDMCYAASKQGEFVIRFIGDIICCSDSEWAW